MQVSRAEISLVNNARNRKSKIGLSTCQMSPHSKLWLVRTSHNKTMIAHSRNQRKLSKHLSLKRARKIVWETLLQALRKTLLVLWLLKIFRYWHLHNWQEITFKCNHRSQCPHNKRIYCHQDRWDHWVDKEVLSIYNRTQGSRSNQKNIYKLRYQGTKNLKPLIDSQHLPFRHQDR